MNIDISNAHCGPRIQFPDHAWLRVVSVDPQTACAKVARQRATDRVRANVGPFAGTVSRYPVANRPDSPAGSEIPFATRGGLHLGVVSNQRTKPEKKEGYNRINGVRAPLAPEFERLN